MSEAKSYINATNAANQLGVVPQTLRRWAKAGTIDHIKTPGGQYRYNIDSLMQTNIESSAEKKTC